MGSRDLLAELAAALRSNPDQVAQFLTHIPFEFFREYVKAEGIVWTADDLSAVEELRAKLRAEAEPERPINPYFRRAATVELDPVELERRELEAAAARMQVLEGAARRPSLFVAQPPPAPKALRRRPRTARRGTVLRRVPEIIANAHAEAVKSWVEQPRADAHPTELHILRSLRRAIEVPDDAQAIPWSAFRWIYSLASLAFALWFSGEAVPGITDREGSPWVGLVVGKPRGELARISPFRPYGKPLEPRTITRHLRRLWELLGGAGGVLQYWQPPPDEAQRKSLPAARGRRPDGTFEVQAFNLYWWRLPQAVEKPVDKSASGSADAAQSAIQDRVASDDNRLPDLVDRSARYPSLTGDQREHVGAVVEAESPQTATTIRPPRAASMVARSTVGAATNGDAPDGLTGVGVSASKGPGAENSAPKAPAASQDARSDAPPHHAGAGDARRRTRASPARRALDEAIDRALARDGPSIEACVRLLRRIVGSSA